MEKTEKYNLYQQGVTTITAVQQVEVRFINTDSTMGVKNVEFDYIWIVITSPTGVSAVFDLSCDDPVEDVGDGTGARTATYTIKIKNYREMDIGEFYTVTLSAAVSAPDINAWDVKFVGGPGEAGDTVIFLGTAGVDFGIEKERKLRVTAKTSPKPAEDTSCGVTVTGQNGGWTEKIYTVTTMNSYEPRGIPEDSCKFIVPGYTVDYKITVTNYGKLSDYIDLDYSPEPLPAGWSVVGFFDYATGTALPKAGGDPNLQNTMLLAHKASQNIIARIARTQPANPETIKGEIGKIDIICQSGYISSQKDIVPTASIVVWELYSISDENIRNAQGVHPYYGAKFAGHNTNPGRVTNFVIHVFKTDTPDVTVTLSVDTAQSVIPAGWVYSVKPSEVTVTGAVGNFAEVILYVVPPTTAHEGDAAQIVVAAQDSSGYSSSVKVITKVTYFVKVYILNLDGLPPEYLTSTLMPNLNTTANEGSKYEGCVDHLIAWTAANHVGIITSADTGTTGILQAGAMYKGWDGTKNLPIVDFYAPSDVKVETIYKTIKSINPDLRTGVISGKNWVADMFHSSDCDIKAHGRSYPYYIDEPKGYSLGQTVHGAATIPDELAKDMPSDEWVIEAAKDMIQQEDPDFIYILLANPDDAGHLYGNALDGDGNPKSINELANPDAMKDVIQTTDSQIGSFKTFLSFYSWYERATIVITSDHGMSTAYQPKQITIIDGKKAVIHREMDVRELLEKSDYKMGVHYTFCAEGGGVAMLTFHTTGTAYLTAIKNELLKYTSADSTVGCYVTYADGTKEVYDVDPMWVVLDQNDMQTGTNSYTGRPYNLYKAGATEIWPDIIVLMEHHYSAPVAPELVKTGQNAFGISVGYWPEFGKPRMVGTHNSWSEQKVALILRGPNIKKGYNNTEGVYLGKRTLDIIPTVCSLNGWRLANGWCFSDHEEDGEVLFDAITQYWGEEKRLTTSDGKESVAPAIAATCGKVGVVWQDNSQGNYEIYYKGSNDNGVTWGGETRITYTTTQSVQPSVAIDSTGKTHVVWVESQAATVDTQKRDELWYANSGDWTNTMKKVFTSAYSSPEYPIENPKIAVGKYLGSDVIHIIFEYDPPVEGYDPLAFTSLTDPPQPYYIYISYLRSTDSGANWIGPTHISETIVRLYDDRVYDGIRHREKSSIFVDDDGNVYTAWEDCTSDYTIKFKMSADGGSNWGSIEVAAVLPPLTAGYPCRACPSLTAAANQIYLLWSEYTDATLNLYYNYRTKTDTVWSSKSKITTGTDETGYGKITIDFFNNPRIVWMDEGDSFAQIYYSWLDSKGTKLVDKQSITFTTYDAKHPVFAVGPNNVVHVAWQDYRDGAWGEIYYRPAIPAAMILSPSSQTITGVALGAITTFELVVKNVLEVPDTIKLATTTGTVEPHTLTLGPHEEAKVMLTVRAPTAYRTSITTYVTAESTADPARRDMAECIVSTVSDGVLPPKRIIRLPKEFRPALGLSDLGINGYVRPKVPGVILPPERILCINDIIQPSERYTTYGYTQETITQTYDMRVTNVFDDEIVVELSIYNVPEGWDAYLSTSSVTLIPGQTTIVTLTVNISIDTPIKKTTLWVVGTMENYDITLEYGLEIIIGAPRAAFTVFAAKVFTHENITFDASQSYDQDGSITNYTWDFGDGCLDYGVNVTHWYIDDGGYIVGLTVTDDKGLSNTAWFIVTILNRPPIADFEVFRNVEITLRVAGRKGNTVTMNVVENGTTIHTLSVTREPGDPDKQAKTITLKAYTGKTYDVVLEYNATHSGANPVKLIFESTEEDEELELTFNTDDGFNQTETMNIDAMLADVLEDVMEYGFDATSSYDIDGTIISYAWDFDDGINGTGDISMHTYTEEGTYTITLTVTDDDGAIDTITTEITVGRRRLGKITRAY